MFKTQTTLNTFVEFGMYAFCAGLLMSSGAIIGASVMNKQVNQLKVEAVQRGYAEWVGEDGRQPSVWRWKNK